MSRRIEVELTSTRDDGTWTWRAAGAKQPKGVLDAGLLYEGARVGDVVRAEADFEMEGITITLVLPPKEKRAEAARLEVIGPPREHQGVTSSLVPKSERPPRRDRDQDRDGPRGDRPSGPRPPRDGTRGDRPPRTDGQRPEGRARPPRPGNDDRPRTGRPERERGPRADRERPGRPERAPRPAGPPRHREPAPPPEPAPKPKKLSPANVHRAAAVGALPPEQQPIAEQVLRGGIPAVRQAIEAQNARLREEGQPEVQGGPLLAIAEQLLPQLKAAEWRDRAEAATKIVDDVSLRDLRSVVAGADLARDDDGRILAGELRQALERRLEEQREKWVADMGGALDEGRLVRALRLSAHPPDTSFRLPAELATRLSEGAGTAMSADTSPDRWGTLLEAVADSPVRRTVKPTALPAEPGESLLQAARQASGRVPALAAMLGIAMPPPPGPPRPARPAGRPPRTGPPPRRRPPAPPTAPAAAETPVPTSVEEPSAAEAPAPTPVDEEAPTAEPPAPTPVDEEAPTAEPPAPAPVDEEAPTAEPPAPTPVDEGPAPETTPGAPADDTAVDHASTPGAESPPAQTDGPTDEALEPAESIDASPLPTAPAIENPPPAADGDQLGGVTPEEPVGSADER